jgi:hypothetical protein
MKQIKESDLRNANKRRNVKVKFMPGGLVLTKAETRNKLDSLWNGPHQIIQVCEEGNKCLVDTSNGREWLSIRNLRWFGEGVGYRNLCVSKLEN